MFGAYIKEYQSVYLSIFTVLFILFLSYQWWRKEKKIKSLPKLLIIAVIGFVVYQIVTFGASVSVYLAHTAKDHMFPDDHQEAIVVDYKTVKNRRNKGPLYYPIVTYINQTGHQAKAPVDTGFQYSMAPKLQEKVKIVVSESNDEVRLITHVKLILVIGELLFVFLVILILIGVTDYALTLHTNYLQIFALVSIFYIVVPLLMIGAGYFFGNSAYEYYRQNNFSSRFWIHISIAVGCILFMTGYINMLREQFKKKKKWKKKKLQKG